MALYEYNLNLYSSFAKGTSSKSTGHHDNCCGWCGLLQGLIVSAFAVNVMHCIQLLYAVTGSMAFCPPEGANCYQGCTKPMDPSHSVQQLFCYTYNCYSSSRNSVIFKPYYDDPLFNKQTNKKQFSRTRGCFVHSAGNQPTPGTIKVMCTCLHHFMVPDLSSHATCLFVARHMVGSRPIKLHSLLLRYNNDSWTTLNRFQELWS